MDAQTRKSEYERLNHHFQACLELAEPERDRYISKLAPSNPGMEKELRALLRFHHGDAAAAADRPVPAAKTSRDYTRTRRKKSWFSAPVLILIVGSISIVVILAVQIWAMARLEGDLKQQMASNLKGAVDLRVSNIRAWMASQKQQTQKVLQDPVLAAHVMALLDAAKDLEDREALRARLTAHPSTAIVTERMLRAPPAISDRGYGIVSSSGVVVAAYLEPALGITISSAGADSLGRVSLGETVVSHPYPDWQLSKLYTPDPKSPVMFVVGPIRNPSGQVIALGFFRFDPSHLYEMLTAANAEFVAFDAKGQVLNNLRGGAELQAWGVASGPETALHAYLRDPGVDLTSGTRPDSPPRPGLKP